MHFSRNLHRASQSSGYGFRGTRQDHRFDLALVHTTLIPSTMHLTRINVLYPILCIWHHPISPLPIGGNLCVRPYGSGTIPIVLHRYINPISVFMMVKPDTKKHHQNLNKDFLQLRNYVFLARWRSCVRFSNDFHYPDFVYHVTIEEGCPEP